MASTYLCNFYADTMQNLMDQVWKRLTKTCINWDESWSVTEDLNDIAGNH